MATEVQGNIRNEITTVHLVASLNFIANRTGRIETELMADNDGLL